MTKPDVIKTLLKNLLGRGRIVHAAYTQSVLVEFNHASDAEIFAQTLQELKAEDKAERKAEMLAQGAGG